MLHKECRDEMQRAMKAKDEVRLSTMRMLLTSITNALVNQGKRPSDLLDDNGVIEVIKRMVKQRKESALQYRENGKEDLAGREDAERSILEVYLPEMMSEEEVRKKVVEIKGRLGVTEKKDKGVLMKEVMKDLKGKADGRTVADAVESELK